MSGSARRTGAATRTRDGERRLLGRVSLRRAAAQLADRLDRGEDLALAWSPAELAFLQQGHEQHGHDHGHEQHGHEGASAPLGLPAQARERPETQALAAGPSVP